MIPSPSVEAGTPAGDSVIDAIAGVLEAVRAIHDSNAVPALGESPTP